VPLLTLQQRLRVQSFDSDVHLLQIKSIIAKILALESSHSKKSGVIFRCISLYRFIVSRYIVSLYLVI
jgi:hypothetical protein